MTTYAAVNAAWPGDKYPAPTPQEAISGTKRLIRLAHRLAINDGAVPKQTRLRRYKFKIVTGRRRNGPNLGVWAVNPNENGYWGWHEIVHSVSHWAQRHYWGGQSHGPRHVWIENELTRYAIKNLIDGQLRRPGKSKPDPVTVRAASVAKRIKQWEAKKRRAESALRKLRKQERYYVRRLGDTGVPAAPAAGDHVDRGTHDSACPT